MISYSSEQCDSEGRSRTGKDRETGVRVWNRMPSSQGGDFIMGVWRETAGGREG